MKASTNIEDILSNAESVSEPTLMIKTSDGKTVGVALISAFGLDDDESVIDHSDNDFFNNWYENYTNTL
jgi:hypothetical protein